ncbi:MAG: HEPN domain-containing protein [Pedosphaera sp.]|nr:HEPN domain-containing protein [Pedosphaera sp.]
MNPLVLEWVQKAEGDFEAMQQLARVRNRPSVLDGVCFHAQQCAEKYFKARLQESGEMIPKTHDLIGLLELLLPSEPMLEPLRPALFSLNRYAVDFRYPGYFATRKEAREAVAGCKKVRAALRETLGLEGQAKLRKQRRSKR